MRPGVRTWFVLGAALHAASCGPSMRSGDSGVADSATDPDAPTAGASGELDTTFSGDGRHTTNVRGADRGRAIAVQPDGRILVAGKSNDDFLLVRYLADGALDASFGMGGVVTTDVGTGADLGFALALQPDGRILVAGTSANDGRNRFSVVRYNTDGTLDATFDGDGRWTRAVRASNDECTGVAVRADGRIVLTGSAYNGMLRDFAAVRLESDGRADETFGDRGALVIPIGERDDGSYAMTLQPDQRVLLVGESVGATDIDLAVVRLR